MANEIWKSFEPGLTLYMVFRQASGANPGYVWKTTTETLVEWNADYTNYDVAMSDAVGSSTNSGLYFGTVPANLPSGKYEIQVYMQYGANPAAEDELLDSFTINWTGSVVSTLLTTADAVAANITQIGGDTQSATDLKDFADTGYDPATHKIEACKVNDDMRGTNSAALASVCTEARLSLLIGINSKTTNLPASPAAIGSQMDIINTPNATAVSAIQNGLALASVCTEARLAELGAANIPADIDTLKTRIPSAITLTSGNVHVHVKANDIVTGYKLAADGLDQIAITDPGGVANTFPKMLVQLWRRFYKKVTATSSQLKTYADDNITIRTTQTVSNDGTTKTVGAAS